MRWLFSASLAREILAVLITVALAACASQDAEEPDISAANAPGMLAESAHTIDERSSYKATVTVGDLENSTRWDLEFDGGSQRVRYFPYAEASSTECLGFSPTEGSPPPECRSSPGFNPNRFLDGVRTESTVFLRECISVTDCGVWEQTPAGPMSGPVVGPHPAYLAGFWPVALGMAYDVEILGPEELDGTPTTHFKANLNPIDARLESEKLAYGVVPAEIVEGLAEQQRDYDDHPAELEVWITESDKEVRQAVLHAKDLTGSPIEIRILYSQWGDVNVEPPVMP